MATHKGWCSRKRRDRYKTEKTRQGTGKHESILRVTEEV